MHIGLIGGIGPAATSFYYQNLVKAYSTSDQTLQLTIAHSDIGQLAQNIANEAAGRQAIEFQRLANQLAAAGADAIAIASIAGHFCFNEFKAISPLPIINAIPAVSAELTQRNITRVGLLGTQVVMNSHFYNGLSDFEIVLPKGNDFIATHDDYIAMAMNGKATPQQRDNLFSIGHKLCEKHGAEIVVLAGTDLFLAFAGHDCGFPVIDSAEIHIQAIYDAPTNFKGKP